MIDVGDGNAVHWEACGNPDGEAAVVMHGGPGSGCSPWFRRLFDPSAYNVVLIDQRNCGRSLPHAGDPGVDLAANTTAALLADVERVRGHLGVERWLVLGGSWGSTLGLAYAVEHPQHVSGLVLFGVTTGRHSEFDWTFRGGLGRLYPAQWERLLAHLPDADRAGDVVEAYHRLLNDPDPEVCRHAAHAWCLWESATPVWPPATELAPRFRDPRYALAFARIVTHYVRRYAWLEDGVLLRRASALAETPGVLVNGALDLQAPLENAHALRRVWPRAELLVADDAGHSPDAGVTGLLVGATDRLRGSRGS
jgi:proline iminopeptidase